MKLFTTITSERGKPVTKSGNEYIEIDINIEARQPTHRIRIMNDGLLSCYYIAVEQYTANGWIELSNNKIQL